ncbi:P-loop containing nucleoside triphosphate hydrolase protein [Auricularia subglabra TFB-10046 SS5]|uniref:Ribosome assembly protein 1 n=1 Tax=Auricularia subglabra (strain TFB-10046 / SS5) TaxID=717982 RepID=J0D2C5_AURST|nr:P-loop containing nucleoside triphosphate hydrolase protein [Auricularia subglabra TFB-10046 SS5]
MAAPFVAPRAELVRVITTIGHVDHGKTTFVDSLLAANNIISSRLAGKIRYMDSREDEQQRGITMESSAVSLQFKVLDASAAPKTYVVNLIDTPGHVDFSSEVSTAARLCDGALVIVDAVEGVCTQTITVLRQAWLDGLKPILVINKFDRLITELKLTPAEGYQHVQQLIEEVNAVMGSFFAAERLEDDLRWREAREARLAARKDAATDAPADEDDGAFEEKDDEDIYFAPDRGNVIFASALDGWGFRVGKFAQLYAQKLGVREANLRRVLWGDFYLDPKTKRVIGQKQLKGRNLKPLFVQFVLDNIWAVYENVVIHPNTEKIEKIVNTLNLKIPPRDLKSKDARHVLGLIFGQWLSLATCTVQAVIDVVPPPPVAQRTRVPKMLHPDLRERSATVEPTTALERDLYACNSDPQARVVGYVSKMFAVPRKELPEGKRKPLTAEEMRARGRAAREAAAPSPLPEAADPAPAPELPAAEDARDPAVAEDETEEVLLGFARLYSGTLRVGARVACVLPKYKPELGRSDARNAKHLAHATVSALYIMMGRELVPVQAVTAGNVFAVAGLEGKVWRSATLCGIEREEGEEELVNLGAVTRQAPPIVRVALEPVIPAEMPKIVRGLKLLSQSDPCVETFQQATGEHVILTAGELHLERCLKDLRERFAKVEITASEPIVPFRETAVRAPDMVPPKAGLGKPRGTFQATAFQGLVKCTLRVVPLPEKIGKLLLENLITLQRMREQPSNSEAPSVEAAEVEMEDDNEGVAQASLMRPEEFVDALKRVCEDVGGEWADAYDGLWMFGPHGAGPNVLLDRRPNEESRRHFSRTGKENSSTGVKRDFEDAVATGFQAATFQGPLCAEPMQGIAVVLEGLEYDPDAIAAEVGQSRLVQITGSLISSVREACRSGMLDWSPRLMLAMYSCEIQASTEALGKMYGVLARRRGRIISEDIKEGTSFFTVRALLPVVESFGFAEDIRKKTSGAASPQLVFSGYELLDEDPFWVPTTEEELEDLGEKADRANIARGYMDAVRSRKGMFVEKKIVEFAEKQRTLKR